MMVSIWSSNGVDLRAKECDLVGVESYLSAQDLTWMIEPVDATD